MIYSQNEEQVWILEACQGAKNRALLDIGAFHPTQFSNSRALIEEGWGAVLVEPSPKPMRNLLDEYGQIRSINMVCAAVCVDLGMVQLHITDDAVSTSEESNRVVWDERGGFFGRMWIPAVTIEGLINQFGAFDFVNIDSEGTSIDLLRVLLATEMFPRCVCVEHDNRIAEAQTIAQKRGYKTVYTSGENLVLVHG